MSEKTVTLAHGAGGKQTSELIDKVFKAHFSNPQFTADDAAVLPALRLIGAGQIKDVGLGDGQAVGHGVAPGVFHGQRQGLL